MAINYEIDFKWKIGAQTKPDVKVRIVGKVGNTQVFTRDQLLERVWAYEYIGDTRTVDVHIKRLREKLRDHDSWSLKTIWGIGYKFEVVQ